MGLSCLTQIRPAAVWKRPLSRYFRKKAVDELVPGLNEVVSGAGILFPVGDEKKLAEEILHLSTDADHYAATAQRCLVRAKNYDISKMVAAHINLYKEILKIQ